MSANNSDFNLESANEESFNLVMETACLKAFFRFKWTAKDLNKYPTEIIQSPMFNVLNQSFQLDLRHLATSSKPEFVIHINSDSHTFLKLNLLFSNSRGEVFCKKEVEIEFCEEDDFHNIEIEELAQKMPQDTIIVKGSMDITVLSASMELKKGNMDLKSDK